MGGVEPPAALVLAKSGAKKQRVVPEAVVALWHLSLPPDESLEGAAGGKADVPVGRAQGHHADKACGPLIFKARQLSQDTLVAIALFSCHPHFTPVEQ